MGKQQKRARSITGSFAVLTLMLAIFYPNISDAGRVFYLGGTFAFSSLAISPKVLLTKFTKAEFDCMNADFTFVSQLLIGISLFLYLTGLVIWLIQ
jgi:hypothetical protein